MNTVMRKKNPHATNQKKQQGAMLLEILIAILIFSVGILGLMGLQAASMKFSADARYRSEAAFIANKIISQIWLAVPKNPTPAALAALMAAVQHHGTAGVTPCAPAGTASGNVLVQNWLHNDVRGLDTANNPIPNLGLPGATDAMQSISVGPAPGYIMTVTVCWQASNETQPHNYVATAQIGKN